MSASSSARRRRRRYGLAVVAYLVVLATLVGAWFLGWRYETKAVSWTVAGTEGGGTRLVVGFPEGARGCSKPPDVKVVSRSDEEIEIKVTQRMGRCEQDDTDSFPPMAIEIDPPMRGEEIVGAKRTVGASGWWPERPAVPGVLGLNAEQAIGALRDNQLRWRVVDGPVSGWVARQRPAPGAAYTLKRPPRVDLALVAR